MREYKVGEEITLVVKESPDENTSCEWCLFYENGECLRPNKMGECLKNWRSDGKNVIFVEKGK